MASSEDFGVEDISPINSSESESSDDEGTSNRRPANSRIAHKEMKNISEINEEESKGEHVTDSQRSAPSLSGEKTYLGSTTGGDNEANAERNSFNIDSTNEQLQQDHENIKTDQALSNNAEFEDISDEGEENEAFSPTEDYDQNYDGKVAHSSASDMESEDEANNKKGNTELDFGGNQQNSATSDDNGDKTETFEQQADEAIDNNYIEAPIPSPFSDIGDISGPENAIISDILKETNDGNHISSELEGFATHLENIEEPVDVTYADNNGTKKDDFLHKKEMAPVAEQATTSDIQHNDISKERDEKDVVGDEKESTKKPGGNDVGGLIADIFGESDEEEEFEGFGEEELFPEKTKAKPRAVISDDDDEGDEAYEEKPPTADVPEEKANEIGTIPSPKEEEESSDDERPPHKEEMISDFDLMMQKKKEAMQHRRRRKRDFDIINDNDDIIAAMIRRMKDAAEEDRMLNQAGQAATKKMKLLDSVVSHLNKSDLQHTFIDCGILPVMKEWLSPLPDNSLPHLMIRKQFLKILSEFPPLDRGALKMSGIGRSLMLLFKHPKETRENKALAGRIISQWARPIFGVHTNFKDMSKEEREERDKQNVPSFKKRRSSSVDDSLGGSSSINSALQDEKRPRRPGDKGFIGRARVPRPSNKDYVVRPQSNVGFMDSALIGQKSTKKEMNRFEKQMKKFKDRKTSAGNSNVRAVSISINGSKMAL